MSSRSKIAFPTSGGSMEMRSIKARCTNTKEVILTEPMVNEEIIELVALAHKLEVKVSINKSGKVLIFKCDDLEEVFEILQEFGLIEYIGSLREIIDWKIIPDTTGNNIQVIKFKPKEGE